MENIKKIPIIASILAVIISVFSLYTTTMQPAEITLSVGESMQIWHNNADELQVDIPVIFTNSGAKSGVIRSLGIIIKDPQSEDAIFIKWYGFKTYKDSINGKSSWIYESLRTPLSVSARSEASKMIAFSSNEAGKNWKPKAITYDIYLLSWNSSNEKPDTKLKINWNFNQDQLSQIQKRLDDGKSKGTWILNSRYASDSRNLSMIEFKELTK